MSTTDEVDKCKPINGTAKISHSNNRKRKWKFQFGRRRHVGGGEKLSADVNLEMNVSATRNRHSISPPDYSDVTGTGVGSRKQTKSETTPVTDGGFGWTVVGASFVAHVIADGCGFSFGVLFAELLDAFGESKSRTAWVGSLFVSIPAVCGPIAGALTTRYGCRVTTIVGGLIAGVGCFASAFARNVTELCLTFGVVAGFGLSLVFVPSVVVVAFYFEKKRAFATGIAAAGSGIGTFVFAPLTEWLIDRYMWRGTLIITAGILLNIVVCGALFRPFPEQPRRRSSGGSHANAAAGTMFDDDIVHERFGIKTTDRRQCRSGTCTDSEHSSMTSPALLEVSEMDVNGETPANQGNFGRTGQSLQHWTTSVDNEGSVVIWTPLGVWPGTHHRYSINDVLTGNSLDDAAPDDDVSLMSDAPVDVACVVNEKSALLPEDRCIRLSRDRLTPSRNSSRHKHRASLDVSAAIPLTDLSVHNEDRQQYARSRSLYSCVVEAVDRLHNGHHHTGSGSSGASRCSVRCVQVEIESGSTSKSIARCGFILRRRDIVHRGSLLSAGALLSAASRRASCPETLKLATLNVRQQHQRCAPSGSMTVSEEPEENDNKIDKPRRCVEQMTSMMPPVNDDGTTTQIVSVSGGGGNSSKKTSGSTASGMFAAIRYVFGSAVFNYFCLHTVLLYVSYDIPYVYGPVQASVNGHTDSQASLLVSIIGIFSTVGQVAMGYAGDQSAIDTLTFYNTMTSVAGLATLAMPLATSFPALAGLNAAYGFFISANFALTTVILVELVGVERLTDAYGIVSLAQGVANLVGPPLAGWLSDTTGSFDLAFYIAGSMTCLSGLMLFLAPCLARYDSYPSSRTLRTQHHIPATGSDDVVSSSTIDRWWRILDRRLPGKLRTTRTARVGVGGHLGVQRHHQTTIDIVVTGDAETGQVVATELVEL